ncbi:MAG: hypothetical protein GVY12_13890 [Bacteroidetes bacterium]|jgi:putative membrane protein|nr:hypothetical protein [Bacteroidota bacterium]
MDPLFSPDDRRRIAAAIEAAETGHTGEVVPYVVRRSAPYAAVPWRGGALGLVLAGMLIGLTRRALPEAFPFLAQDGLAFLLVIGAAAAVALLSSALAPVTRWLIPKDHINRAVGQRAKVAFVEEEVFATRGRTGILLFVSLLEHRIEVLADAGIYAHVANEAWQAVADHIRSGMESDSLTEGLIAGIAACGKILQAHGFEADADNPDELRNQLRTSEE